MSVQNAVILLPNECPNYDPILAHRVSTILNQLLERNINSEILTELHAATDASLVETRGTEYPYAAQS